jgi:gamma-glutamyl-gamma-aminobutyrate hydrolase PuuD
VRKVGISLRTSNADSYVEDRDAIATDWYTFLKLLDWKQNWVLLPNLGNETAEYAKYHNIEGIILTGGDNIGSNTRRDVSEEVLLDFAIQQNVPVLGVCRGLQQLYLHYGGKLINTDDSHHVATRHQVKITTPLPFKYSDGSTIEVNSYHSQLLAPSITNINVMARDKAGFVEGIIDAPRKIAGVMWHPEREPTCASFDRALFNWLFKD